MSTRQPISFVRSNRRRQRRPVANKPKPKPLSEQSKRAVAKEVVSKEQTLHFQPLQKSDKIDLSSSDIRHHLPTQDLNRLYYKAASNLAAGRGRCSFEPGPTFGDGTAKFVVKLKLSSEQSMKMLSGMSNRASANPEGDVNELLKSLTAGLRILDTSSQS